MRGKGSPNLVFNPPAVLRRPAVVHTGRTLDPEVAQFPASLSDEARKRLDSYWKEKRTPLSRASMEQFRKEMKNAEVVEIKGSTHYVFVGTYKDQVIKLVRDFLMKG